MVVEIDDDIRDGVLVFSKRLNDIGNAQYPTLLRSAASLYDEAWLGEQLKEIARS